MVNHVVAMEFPALQKKVWRCGGDLCRLAESPHPRAEFRLFDMTQVARNRYTSDRYHDFIGFEISQGLLEARISQSLWNKVRRWSWDDEDLAIGSFRHGREQG